MDLTAKLTMTCNITPILSQDIGADPVYGTPEYNVPCFVYGVRSRQRNTQADETRPDFQALFFPDVSLATNYLIKNVRFNDNLILDSGVIVRVEEFNHPSKGLIIKQASIEKR